MPALEDISEEIPFGLQVAPDGRRLQGNPGEIEVLLLLMEEVVRDGPLSKAAQAINERGHRTRAGSRWTASDLYWLLPRLIDLGPRITKSGEWAERRKRLFQAALT